MDDDLVSINDVIKYFEERHRTAANWDEDAIFDWMINEFKTGKWKELIHGEDD